MPTTRQRRERLSIDVSGKQRRRLRIAAAKHDQSIRDYVWDAVEARMRGDGINERPAGDLLALTEDADPVLAALWDNPKDAAYDDV
jgi:uncharacterized protein (DUF1778 family)